MGNQFPLDALNEAYFQATPDTQNITFNFITDGVNVITNQYFAFRYYIFANDGI